MTTMRAKLYVTSITRFSSQSEVLEFAAVCAKSYSGEGYDEDNTYAKFSPSATLKITIANPALLGKFNPGDRFYVDFTPVDAA